MAFGQVDRIASYFTDEDALVPSSPFEGARPVILTHELDCHPFKRKRPCEVRLATWVHLKTSNFTVGWPFYRMQAYTVPGSRLRIIINVPPHQTCIFSSFPILNFFIYSRGKHFLLETKMSWYPIICWNFFFVPISNQIPFFFFIAW